MQGGATHVDIACDPELVKLAVSLTSLPVTYYSFLTFNRVILIILFSNENTNDYDFQVCVSSVDPAQFLAAVDAGALMV